MLAAPPRIDRDLISQTGILPPGIQLFQDSMPMRVLDLKRLTTKNPLFESVQGAPAEVSILRCTGVFQRADEKNANGRIYPLSILKEAVNKIQKGITERRVMGEFDHPPDAKIHMDRVCHLVTALYMDSKNVIGELEVFNDSRMPCGSMLACLLERKVQVGISSRGVGDMELVMHEGADAYQVQEGFEFITFDSVAEPSVSGTQLQRLNESLERQNPARRRAIRAAYERLLVNEIRKSFVI